MRFFSLFMFYSCMEPVRVHFNQACGQPQERGDQWVSRGGLPGFILLYLGFPSPPSPVPRPPHCTNAPTWVWTLSETKTVSTSCVSRKLYGTKGEFMFNNVYLYLYCKYISQSKKNKKRIYIYTCNIIKTSNINQVRREI